MTENSTLRDLTEAEVASIFANPESEAARRWIGYWASTEARNAVLLSQFRKVVSLGFTGRTVLDVGCGSAGLAAAVVSEGGKYVGLDYSPYVLRMGRQWLSQKEIPADLIRATGSGLPFRDESFDSIFAFDVIEHLEWGDSQQLQFLRELRRVIRPHGMIFLTTPNKWYPFEGHTFLYFPQYLPVAVADQYIRRRNPGFLQEHGSFEAIKLLTPSVLRRLLDLSGLAFLHGLPCALDIEDLPPGRRLGYRLLNAAGLSWYPMQEFWGCLVLREERESVRAKCGKHHVIALREAQDPTLEFQAGIDFSRGPEAHQLKDGWFPYESVDSGFRWTMGEADFWLQAEGDEQYVAISGHCNAQARAHPTTLSIFCDNQWIGQHRLFEDERFHLRYLLPEQLRRSQICTFRVTVDPCFVPSDADRRKLGVAISRLALEPTPVSGGMVDFNRGPQPENLGEGWFAHQRDPNGEGFRWTAQEAELRLSALGTGELLLICGYCNAAERHRTVSLQIYCDDRRLAERTLEKNEAFKMLLPPRQKLTKRHTCAIRLITDPCYVPGDGDERRLGVAIHRLGLIEESALPGAIDFNDDRFQEGLGSGWFAPEGESPRFRWTAAAAEVWMCAAGTETRLAISGYCNAGERPEPVTLRVWLDGEKIGEHRMDRNECFDVHLTLSSCPASAGLHVLRLVTDPPYLPIREDQRVLGMMFFKIALE